IEQKKWQKNYVELKIFLVDVIKAMYNNTLDVPAKYLEGSIAKQSNLFGSDIEEELSELLTFEEMNKKYLKLVLQKTGGKIYGEYGAAEILGMPPTTLQSKLKKLGIK